MYVIEKVLNNNAILVKKDGGDAEYVLLGNGIGFHQKPGQVCDEASAAKCYKLQKETDKGPSMEILNTVDPIFLEISNEIITLARVHFPDLDTNILLPLADHIAFAIERIRQQMDIANPFSNDIRLLFPEEYEIAVQGQKIIEHYTGVCVSEDELGYITLHLHAARSDEKVDQGMLIAVIVNESIKEIEAECNISIDDRSLSYSRLLMHMKYMLARLAKGEKLHLDMEDYTKTNFPYAYESAQHICQKIQNVLHKQVPAIEIGYLALHIERIRSIHQEE